MSKSSIQTAANGTGPALQVVPAANGKPRGDGPPADDFRTGRRPAGLLSRLLRAAASLRLTVVLFALSIVLIFSGTLAQMDAGIGNVVKDYFRSLYVWIPLQLFIRFGQVFFNVPHMTRVAGAFPFPGGWLIGGLLMLNLLAAHAVRFRLSWKRSGVLVLHAGILLLMAGELLTGLFAVEGQMTIPASGGSNVIKHRESPELSLIGPLESAPDDVTVVSANRLRQGGVVQHDLLPFDVQIDEFMPNSQVADAPLQYSVPKGWQVGGELVKSGIRREAVFQFKEGEETAEVSITPAAGSARANIDRWRGQVGLKPLTDEEYEHGIQTSHVAGSRALYVDLSGKGDGDRTRILGVAVPRRFQSCFIVMRGPAELVGKQKGAFEAFLKSMRADGRATAGEGVGLIAEAAREGAGVDAEQRIDMASAFVTLKKKGSGESLGTYLASEWLSELASDDQPGQQVAVDGKTYAVALRFKRTYTPYTFQLLAFHHDNYPGTDIPNNFSSEIRILDPERHVDRQVNIHMNVPLRYQRSSDEPWWQLLVRGQETYYQQGFLPGDTGTILQVVRNPGWLAPYFACCMVGLGMVIHFAITLSAFLRKRRLAGAARFQKTGPSWLLPAGVAIEVAAAAIVCVLYMTGNYLPAAGGFLATYAGALVLLRRASRGAAGASESGGFGRIFPWLAVAAAGTVVGVAMLPPREKSGAAKLQDLASLPVQADGRVKPLDTVARVTLAGISTKQVYDDAKRVSHPAIEWLADLMTYRAPTPELEELWPKQPRHAPHDYAIFRIENDQLLTELGLERREGLRYAYQEFAKKLPKVIADARAAADVPEKDRSLYQTHAIELFRKFRTYAEAAQLESPRLIPPENPAPNADWLTLPEAVERMAKLGRKDAAAIALIGALQSYAEDRPQEFNERLNEYRGLIAAKLPTETAKAELETFFNDFAPFYVCMPLYVVVFLLAAFSWIGWARPLNRAAFWLAVLALVIHTFGLATRMYLQGRPPVTNLYSSAVFIGWMSVLLGLALEVIYGLGLGNALAGALGFTSVLIAHNLASGDTLEMMRAVLDTNFWLATHVVCVSTGYAATLLAGILGVLYILGGVLTNSRDDKAIRLVGAAIFIALVGAVALVLLLISAAAAAFTVVAGVATLLTLVVSERRAYKVMSDMLYGILCFATLFSFVGTVLGGIWADQSWGRFWGWDPKENGALLIVIMNALILHARWSGMVKDRGAAVLAVCGNILTGWSWFGTNQLGVGLHSYGFTSGLSATLVSFWAFMTLTILLGTLIPIRYWRGVDDIKASSVAASRGNLGPAIA
jgi:ABC-type transport system involved in cytochrome c biogenesis permease subunit